MPADPLLDFAALLAPVPGDDPSGGATPFAVRQQLDEARKEVDPSAFAPDDPMRPTEFKPADWATVLRVAQDALKTKAKDLLVACRLTEAAVKLHGFAGLRDGLRLLTLLLTDCWDRLAPKVDDPSDLDIRSGPFEWLDDPDRGGRFPTTVRQVPLVRGEAGPLSWADWKRGMDGKDRAAAEAFEKAVLAAPADPVRDADATLAAARQELDALTGKLADRLGDLAPGMIQLRRAIDDNRSLVGLILDRKGASAAPPPPAPAADAVTPASPGGTPAPTAARPSPAAPTRDDVYRQLGELARQLERLEPHSPVPYLIRRAVGLGSLPFPEMIKNLVRDANVLSDIARDLALETPGDG